jgi:inner membrane transporter RhtA
MVVFAVTSLQLGAGFAATLFDDLGPAGTAFLRQTLAALVLLAVWRPRMRGPLGLALAFGATLGAMNWMIYTAMDRIPLGIAVTLEFLGPLGVAVAGSRRALDGLWVVLAAAGIVLLSNGGTSGLDTAGVVLALSAGACWAGYILLNARLGQAFAGGHGLAIAMAVGALAMAAPGIAGGGGGLLDAGSLGLAFAVAMLSSVVPYSLELEALRRIRPHVFGVLMSLEPAVAALAGLVLLGQSLSAVDVVAIVLVVTASAGATRGARGPAPVDA